MIYNYLFFSFYRFWEKGHSRWWSEWKAIISMIFLWIALISTICNFHFYYFRTITLSDYPVFALMLCAGIGVIHHFLFTHNDKWKGKIVQFKSLERKIDTLGIIAVILLTALIIVSLIYSYYLLGSINWSEVK